MTTQPWTPADILQLSGGYWSACALHAAVKLDIFTPLATRAHTAAELSASLHCDARGTAMLLDSIAALKLITKTGESYLNTPFANEYLSKTSQKYLGHIIQHHHHLMASWAHLDEAVKGGEPIRTKVSHADEEVTRESFLMGMFNLAMQLAPRIVRRIDLTGRRRLLDLGGGPGTYAIHFCRENPELTAVVYDLPTTRRFAEQTIERFDLAKRISFQEGDFTEQGISGSFDVVWLSHILHGEGPEECARLLKKAAAALTPGGIILIQEFILDDTRDTPLFPALFSLNMLLGTPLGQSYSQSELFGMLAAAGAGDMQRIPLELPNGAGVVMGVLPGKN